MGKARENAISNEVKNISFLESDIFKNVNNKFDIIVSNPPYIKTKDIAFLDKNVREYEPVLALDGGESGLVFYENIISNSKNFLNDNGYLGFEIGYDQANDLEGLFKLYNFKNIIILKDLAGLDRVAFASTSA